VAIPILVLIEIPGIDLAARLTSAGLAPTFAVAPSLRAETIRLKGGRFRAVLTHGSAGLSSAELALLPGVEIICALGAGHENIDSEATRARGVVVTHGPGTNATTVADHAMALLLAAVRGIVPGYDSVRRGEWAKWRVIRPLATGKRMGIMGLGTIGREIAKRGAGGFGMEIGYHNRRPQDDAEFRYFQTLIDLAAWSDFLVVAAPGGGATRGLVGAEVLRALGPDGFLVNIARGSIVDTSALIAALRDGTIAGAALDVVDGEPEVPADLLAQPNALITPHSAGRSPESIVAMVGMVIENLTAHFAGRPVLTPVRA